MIYLGNGIYSDSGPDTLSHYGRKGMKWGQHIFGDETVPIRKKIATGAKIAATLPLTLPIASTAAATVGGAALAAGAIARVSTARDKRLSKKSIRLYSNPDGSLSKQGKDFEKKYKKLLAAEGKVKPALNEMLDNVNKEYMRRYNTKKKWKDSLQTPRDEENVYWAAKSLNVSTKPYDDAIEEIDILYLDNDLNSNAINAYESIVGNKKPKQISHSDDMSSVLMSDLKDSGYLEHYGRLGMKWGQHIFGDDENHISRRQKRKEAKLQKKNQKLEAKRQRKEEKKRKRKIPKTAAALARRMDSLTDEEFEEAYKNIRKRAAVKDAAISDAYRLEKVLNYPNVFLNDATNAAKNIDYWRWKLSGQGTIYPSGFHMNVPQKQYTMKGKPSAKATPTSTKATVPNDPLAGFTVYEPTSITDPATGRQYAVESLDQTSKYDERGNYIGRRKH